MSSLFYKCKQRLLRLFSDLFPVRFVRLRNNDFEEIAKYTNMQYQNAFKKLRSIEN